MNIHKIYFCFIHFNQCCNLNKINECKWINKQTCCPIVILFMSLWTISYLYIIKNRCLNCTMVLYQLYSWDKVETKSTLFLWANCGKYKLLWVLLIDNILVYKLMKCLVACHGNSFLFSIYFCVKNQDAKSFSTVLSLPF